MEHITRACVLCYNVNCMIIIVYMNIRINSNDNMKNMKHHNFGAIEKIIETGRNDTTNTTT